MVKKKAEMTSNMMMRENPLWMVIRKNSKFCARCGGGLDIPYKDFHLPFCMKCRDGVISNIRRENNGKKKA